METAYLRRLRGRRNYTTPLGPQALEDLAAERNPPTFDANKNDVFMIGVTVLCCVCEVRPGDEGIRSLYRPNGRNMTVNFDEINRHLSALDAAQRDPTLIGALRVMLAPAEADRPSLYQVLEFLRLASA